MADLHEAYGPAPSGSAGIPLQHAIGPTSPDKAKLRVFISYSRDDLKFADQFDDALAACGFECLIDREGISGGEAWKRRLGNLISDADTICFVLSPSSARSDTCNWEVEEAARLNKRILPVVCRPLEGMSAPPHLSDLNYIFFYEEPKDPGSGFGNGLAKLIAALNTDFNWLRGHTRYLQRAMEWEAGGRRANRLLSGNDIDEAKAWATRRPNGAPEPTTLHLEFIRASEEEAEAQLSALRKQLEAMAAAQAERETALHQAEDAQRKRAGMARIRNIALVAVSILFVLAAVLGLAANQQRRTADDLLTRATHIISNLQSQMDIDTQKEAFAVFQEGAEHGNTRSMRDLGVAYESGYGATQDYAKAREWFEKAVDNGDARAMTSLGSLYEDGHGVTQDYAKAREWFEKAVEKGDALAMISIGSLYEDGHSVAQNYAKAREWYEKAAAIGDESAMASLALLYVNGHGVTQDYAKAREWFGKAATKGEALAMTNLGLLYVNGKGVAQDFVTARDWFEKAADKGDARAMINLGLFYENGYGVAQDYGKAREWFEKAVDKDEANAMTNLGLLYENGHGVTQDYARAREWYEQAAVNNDALAMVFLGKLYRDGHGVAQDYAKAREWYEKAATKDDEIASAVAKADLEKLPIQ
jgi:TPR repeat protein